MLCGGKDSQVDLESPYQHGDFSPVMGVPDNGHVILSRGYKTLTFRTDVHIHVVISVLCTFWELALIWHFSDHSSCIMKLYFDRPLQIQTIIST